MEERKGISGNVIKWIAMLTMWIDHIGVTVFWELYKNAPDSCWHYLYEISRCIGRISFPLYCFVLVEGFSYTKNWKKYAGRLLVFAVLSEIPFNLAVSGNWFSWEYNNVLFTMLIGILMLQGMKWALEKEKKVLAFFVIVVCYVLAEVCHVDYGSIGIMVILIFYILRKEPVIATLGACLVLCFLNVTEAVAMLAIIPIKLYNKKRGKQNQYFFYLVYPVHLLILGLVVKYFM